MVNRILPPKERKAANRYLTTKKWKHGQVKDRVEEKASEQRLIKYAEDIRLLIEINGPSKKDKLFGTILETMLGLRQDEIIKLMSRKPIALFTLAKKNGVIVAESSKSLRETLHDLGMDDNEIMIASVILRTNIKAAMDAFQTYRELIRDEKYKELKENFLKIADRIMIKEVPGIPIPKNDDVDRMLLKALISKYDMLEKNNNGRFVSLTRIGTELYHTLDQERKKPLRV